MAVAVEVPGFRVDLAGTARVAWWVGDGSGIASDLCRARARLLSFRECFQAHRYAHALKDCSVSAAVQPGNVGQQESSLLRQDDVVGAELS